MTSSPDLIIVGAGPAGLSLAAALAPTDLSIVVIERADAGDLAQPAFDGREIALTLASRARLQDMGVWARLADHEIAPLKRAQVLDGWDQTVREICRANQIIYQGFSLLTANSGIFAEPALRAMAAKYQTGLAQIVFRFSQQVGMLPLTGTTNPQHMKDDLQSDRFTLLPEEIKQIETIGM